MSVSSLGPRQHCGQPDICQETTAHPANSTLEAVRGFHAARQESLATSRVKVWAASSSPSAMIRYGHDRSAICPTVILLARVYTAAAILWLARSVFLLAAAAFVVAECSAARLLGRGGGGLVLPGRFGPRCVRTTPRSIVRTCQPRDDHNPRAACGVGVEPRWSASTSSPHLSSRSTTRFYLRPITRPARPDRMGLDRPDSARSRVPRFSLAGMLHLRPRSRARRMWRAST